MTVSNKISIISSSVIINEGLKGIIHQITGSYLIEDFIDWHDFLENFDRKVHNQTIFVEIKSLPKKEKLKSLNQIVNNNVTPVLLFADISEISDFDDFVSIPFTISKEELTKELSDLLLNGQSEERNNSVLSERETTILKEVALGLTNKEISDKLYISMHTVITHRKNITAKLGIKTISGLTVYAIINNVISPTDLKQ